MRNLVVAKYIYGTLVKGYTHDFLPTQEEFHIQDENDPSKIETVYLSKLKALFFVKTTKGNRAYTEHKDISKRRMYGKPVEVKFLDGEVIRGYTQVYNREGKGFFMFPADDKSNNERIFVIWDATQSVKFL